IFDEILFRMELFLIIVFGIQVSMYILFFYVYTFQQWYIPTSSSYIVENRAIGLLIFSWLVLKLGLETKAHVNWALTRDGASYRDSPWS
ncbi:hypothetical protein ACJX0J_023620, partial [Zea mays]